MTTTRFKQLIAIAAAIPLLASLIVAHDLFATMDVPAPKVGEKATVKFVLGHNFPAGATQPKAEFLKAKLISPQGKTSPLTLAGNGIYQTATFTPEMAGAYVIAADYTYYFGRTAGGATINKPKNEQTEAAQSTSYVSQGAKIIVGSGGDAALKPVGLNLEIVPQVDPATIKPGQALPVQVLWKGKPLASSGEDEVDVKAVYAGFQLEEDTFAFAGHTDKNGMCRIKLTQAGTWMVIVERRIPASEPTKADHEVYKGTLVFHLGGSAMPAEKAQAVPRR